MTETTGRLTGQVKWFNTKAGYGFITVCSSDESEMIGKDIFVHFSSIKVLNSQYRYLVQGEYVEFNLVKTTDEKHEYHADDISGIKRGLLMCEMRDSKNSESRYKSNSFSKSDDVHDKASFKKVISKRARRENEPLLNKKAKNPSVQVS